MKYVLITVLSIFTLSSWGNMHGKGMRGMMKDKETKEMWNKMSFEDAKQMKSDKLARKKAIIEDAQTCVDKTKDKDGLTKCWKEMKEDKHEMHTEMHEKMKKKM